MANLTSPLILGIKRRWLDGLRSSFAVIGVLWTFTELSMVPFPKIEAQIEGAGYAYFGLLIFVFAIVFGIYVYEPRKVQFYIPGSDTKISLVFADLFEQEANIIVGVNEFFDGELGVPVAEKTVHGQLIARNFAGNSAAFRAVVDPALRASGQVGVFTARQFEPKISYPIGTTISILKGSKRIFLMAMARTDLATSKAESDVPTLWLAIQKALDVVNAYGGGLPLAMPLFGNGQAGLKLEPQHLLRLLVMGLVDFAGTGASRLPKDITITLHESCFDKLNIREIARDWERK